MGRRCRIVRGNLSAILQRREMSFGILQRRITRLSVRFWRRTDGRKRACKGRYCFDRKAGGIASGRKPVCTLCQVRKKQKKSAIKTIGNLVGK